MAHIVSFINYKGGVGKTTTTYHVGCALAYAHGKRVLLVDIDPQCNLTLLCAVWSRWEDYVKKGGVSVATLYERRHALRALPSRQAVCFPEERVEVAYPGQARQAAPSDP
jgi:cellulose biosynthesis protein BcsQ